MLLLETHLVSPAENLAVDEALLEWCEERQSHGVLRLWEPKEAFVVLGYANKLASEVNLEACLQHGIPVLRRASGGGTVLQGPGSLNYSLVLPLNHHPALQSIPRTNQYVLGLHAQGLTGLLARPVRVAGITDLVLGDLKFSGNAQRRRRTHLLFHGSFLLDLDLELMNQMLRMPSHQPPYRRNRPHTQFVMNLRVPSQLLKKTLRALWEARDPFVGQLGDRLDRLVRERYANEDWIRRC